MCNEPDAITLDRDLFTEKKKKIFKQPTIKELPTEIEDIAAMKNYQKQPEVPALAKIVRSVYPDTIYNESACLMNSKFKVDTKDKLSNALKDQFLDLGTLTRQMAKLSHAQCLGLLNKQPDSQVQLTRLSPLIYDKEADH